MVLLWLRNRARLTLRDLVYPVTCLRVERRVSAVEAGLVLPEELEQLSTILSPPLAVPR